MVGFVIWQAERNELTRAEDQMKVVFEKESIRRLSDSRVKGGYFFRFVTYVLV
jgi:hypothetical protein